MKRTFKVKQKAFFINLKEFTVNKNCQRPESAPFSETNLKIWQGFFVRNLNKFL